MLHASLFKQTKTDRLTNTFAHTYTQTCPQTYTQLHIHTYTDTFMMHKISPTSVCSPASAKHQPLPFVYYFSSTCSVAEHFLARPPTDCLRPLRHLWNRF